MSKTAKNCAIFFVGLQFSAYDSKQRANGLDDAKQPNLTQISSFGMKIDAQHIKFVGSGT